MRIAVLWTCLSGYLNACFKELASREGVELFVSHQVPQGTAPYDEHQFDWITNRFRWKSMSDLESLPERVRTFGPEVMVVAGWHVAPYRSLARTYSGRCWRVMTMDNQWRGSLKQWVGVMTAPYYVRRIADAVWVPGERQAVFAKKFGFQQQSILHGLFAPNPEFAKVYLARVSESRPVPRRFLFAGRFVPEKGLDLLVHAYEAYAERTQNPWPLICCGAGPLRNRLVGKPGIEIHDFVQPDDLPGKFASAGCLVVPSLFEPWGVVVQEATSSGLLVLASETVGAVPHLVQPNHNGFRFSRDPEELANLMTRVSSMSDARLNEMSKASFSLSQQYSPCRCADTLMESVPARR